MLSTVVGALCCLTFAFSAIGQGAQGKGSPIISGKTVFGMTLGAPVTLPACPVTLRDAKSYGLDFEAWNKNQKVCYWSPELGATLPVARGYVLVLYPSDEQPRLPGISEKSLIIFALTINQGKATTLAVITQKVSDQDLVDSVSRVLGPSHGGESQSNKALPSSSHGREIAWWWTDDLGVTLLSLGSNEPRSSLFFTDKASLNFPRVNSNQASDAAEEAAHAATTTVQTHNRSRPATPPDAPQQSTPLQRSKG